MEEEVMRDGDKIRRNNKILLYRKQRHRKQHHRKQRHRKQLHSN